jgi:hypothetical protein
MLGEGIECTELKSIPTKINAKDKSSILFTRPESRGVVADVFHRFAVEADDGGSVAAITGLPGIGKSWTLLYALQQALLYDGATVVFFFQKRDIALLYLRRKNKIYAWRADSKPFAKNRLFERTDVLVLLDPKEATQGGAQFALGEVKLLYAASNNKKQFATAAEKDDGNMQTFLGPPLDGELQVILARLRPQLKQDVIQKRKQNVGNLIRYILDKDKYDKRRTVIKNNVQSCVTDSLWFQRALLTDFFSDGENTVPGTLFQMFPKRPKDPTDVGYDGQNVQYRKRVVQAATDNVRDAIVSAGQKVILSYFGKVGSAERAKMGNAVEALFIKDLMNPDGFGDEKIPSNDIK